MRQNAKLKLHRKRIRKMEQQSMTNNETPNNNEHKKGCIYVVDGFEFRRIVDIANFFGKEYAGYQRACFPVAHEYEVWCPTLCDYDDDDNPLPMAGGYINKLSADGKTIIQSNDDPDPPCGELRYDTLITFARNTERGRNFYRFIGVFKVNKNHPDTSDKVKVHERIEDHIDLSRWLQY